jgi:hypothetical protein
MKKGCTLVMLLTCISQDQLSVLVHNNLKTKINKKVGTTLKICPYVFHSNSPFSSPKYRYALVQSLVPTMHNKKNNFKACNKMIPHPNVLLQPIND